MSKRGLPTNLKMRHDWHYVEELTQTQRSIGRILPINKIEPNPEQPRTDVGDLTELSSSIKEKGILEPLLVKPLPDSQRWMIIAGERRWRAAQIAGLTEVPCIELDVDETQIAEIALIENLQRKDLTVWEEADALAVLCQKFAYTHEDLARRIGKSRSAVTESLTIAALPLDIRARCERANLKTKSAILQIARQFDDAAMIKAIEAFERPTDSEQNVISPETEAVENSPAKTAAAYNAPKASSGDSIKTDLNHPVRVYNYVPSQGNFKLALKFKKPVEKQAIISILRSIINELEDEN